MDTKVCYWPLSRCPKCDVQYCEKCDGVHVCESKPASKEDGEANNEQS